LVADVAVSAVTAAFFFLVFLADVATDAEIGLATSANGGSAASGSTSTEADEAGDIAAANGEAAGFFVAFLGVGLTTLALAGVSIGVEAGGDVTALTAEGEANAGEAGGDVSPLAKDCLSFLLRRF
jgi:hypothetical protein